VWNWWNVFFGSDTVSWTEISADVKCKWHVFVCKRLFLTISVVVFYFAGLKYSMSIDCPQCYRGTLHELNHDVSYHRRTTWCHISVEILSTASQITTTLKISKSVDVGRSHSKPRQCRFLRHIVVDTCNCYISRGMAFRKVSNSKNYLRCHWCWPICLP